MNFIKFVDDAVTQRFVTALLYEYGATIAEKDRIIYDLLFILERTYHISLRFYHWIWFSWKKNRLTFQIEIHHQYQSLFSHLLFFFELKSMIWIVYIIPGESRLFIITFIHLDGSKIVFVLMLWKIWLQNSIAKFAIMFFFFSFMDDILMQMQW